MALDGKTKMDPADVFADHYVEVFGALVDIKRNQIGEGPTFERISQHGDKILRALAGEEKGLSIVALSFALLAAIEDWPALRKALETKSPIVIAERRQN